MTTPRNLSSRYELGEILGFGGMSEVHLARDLRLSRDVAIKVLRADLARDPTFYLRFRREAHNAAALNHPAIVAVYDTGEAETEAGPLPYIVMEYVDGDTLRDIVRSNGPMAPRHAMEVIADVCAALDFSHRNGIVHRDVKPANIMINRAGAVKVMDFGIARAISDASSPMTQTAAVIGTAQYLSPEQARGEQVDARSDVYSLGCVLFEVLTGEPPFSGDSPVAVAYQHVREDPPTPSEVNRDIPRELDSIILKAMSKNPANRYQSAGDMRSDLVRVLGGQRPSAPMVMNDEDRTTILGSVGSDTGNFRTAPDPVDPVAPATKRRAPEPPAKKKGLRYALMGFVAVAVLALIAVFMLNVNSPQTEMVTVPANLTNQPADAAEATLRNAGFQVERQQKTDKVVAAGNVITTRPVAGVRVEKGSTVTLDVSTGPEQVAIPRLTGLSQDDAERKLNAVGLRLDPTIGQAASTVAEVDKVVNQDPAVGVSVTLDSAVSITVGTGPEQVRVPDVTGQRQEVAKPNIEGAGFVVQITEIDSGLPKGQVVSTDPAGGTSATKGTTVTLRVSNGNKIAMPDLTNKNVSDALATLRTAGWAGTATQLVQTQTTTLVPEMVGKIVSQTQPAGSEISKDSVITVSVGALGIPGR
ncbi:Stk1 family PASTA domain-containing Ser/Thr kinase [Rhodococcus sp. IEGM 1379]|uniref:Stk1 family PASTA domain-containing Ser/Thr kinase n=1 Tax=Rhodococcus sp. IEGM 1379 TaxID=3047086 RepID=UPI0024B69C16|nr:Stk1 family PASTA domain-containing Ser/Thr kinase [Rhodococcus sp. IEGM 1379]MDI9917666.1 Stk1 family PASTA domain-containing Ser/Thr kinase [Rhodococcus sp. IEGM 1379]